MPALRRNARIGFVMRENANGPRLLPKIREQGQQKTPLYSKQNLGLDASLIGRKWYAFLRSIDVNLSPLRSMSGRDPPGSRS
jgi:hypothetical protein